MAARVDASGGTGCARCRRERRLRSHLRHERMAVAMALAESTHHSAQRQKTARAGREARDALHGHVPEAPLPQGRVLRHVVGHLCVLALDVLGPQLVDQLLVSCSSLPHSRLFPSSLSKCPRSCLMMSLCAPLCAIRSWWNGWWKCRRSFPIPRYSGLWSSTSTFQFLVVEDLFLVFKVFPPNRVQQRCFF